MRDKQMFEQIKKMVDEYYDDDGSHVFERYGGKIYFIWSNRHNGQLAVIISNDTQELMTEIDKKYKDEDNNSIVYIIREVMINNGGVVIGKL